MQSGTTICKPTSVILNTATYFYSVFNISYIKIKMHCIMLITVQRYFILDRKFCWNQQK